MKNTKWGLVPIVILLALGRASYAELGPKKASSLVTMFTTSGCVLPELAFASQFTTRIMPDGNSVPFVMPENQVLIVTDVDWGNSSGVGNEPRMEKAFLFLLHESTAHGALLASSIAVNSGVPICIFLASGNVVDARLQGYLAPNK
jgi:hypothetical protein